jgi:hypothetical protein
MSIKNDLLNYPRIIGAEPGSSCHRGGTFTLYSYIYKVFRINVKKYFYIYFQQVKKINEKQSNSL